MIGALFSLARPALHALDPETAHHASIRALSLLPPRRPTPDDRRLGMTAFGLDFPNPLGLAAGYDKQCDVPDQLLGLGFGFIECGGVTPLPQPGNPRPRVFRLTRDGAIINRFGLNSDGLAAISGRLRRRRGRPGIVGVNLGANKESRDRIADYVMLVTRLCGLAQFLTINIFLPNNPRPAPNLPGLGLPRRVCSPAAPLRAMSRCQRLVSRTALLDFKIAPDMDEAALDGLVAIRLRAPGSIGMIVSNTHHCPPCRLDGESHGGRGWRPLRGGRLVRSTGCGEDGRCAFEGRVPLMGVGGIDSPQAVNAKTARSGRAEALLASSIRPWCYQGPGLSAGIKRVSADHL